MTDEDTKLPAPNFLSRDQVKERIPQLEALLQICRDVDENRPVQVTDLCFRMFSALEQALSVTQRTKSNDERMKIEDLLKKRFDDRFNRIENLLLSHKVVEDTQK